MVPGEIYPHTPPLYATSVYSGTLRGSSPNGSVSSITYTLERKGARRAGGPGCTGGYRVYPECMYQLYIQDTHTPVYSTKGVVRYSIPPTVPTPLTPSTVPPVVYTSVSPVLSQGTPHLYRVLVRE